MKRGFCLDKFDRIVFDAERTREGFVKGRAFVSRYGVFDYFGPDGKRYPTLRHPDDVLAGPHLDSFKNLPIQVGHNAMLDAGNMARFKVGNTGSDVRVEAPFISVDFVIDDARGLAAIDAGIRELSCGYWRDLVEESGFFDGAAYVLRQLNLEENHIAICEHARLGHELRIDLDGASVDSAPELWRDAAFDSQPSQEPTLMKIKLPSGVERDAADDVAAYIGTLVADLDTARSETTTAKNALKAEEDRHQATKELLQAEKDGFEAKVKAAAALRSTLDSAIEKFVPEANRAALKDKPAMDCKKAVIAAWRPTLSLDGKSEAAIDSLFEAAVADGKPAENAAAEIRGQGGDQGGSKKIPTAAELDAEQRNAWTGAHKIKAAAE